MPETRHEAVIALKWTWVTQGPPFPRVRGIINSRRAFLSFSLSVTKVTGPCRLVSRSVSSRVDSSSSSSASAYLRRFVFSSFFLFLPSFSPENPRIDPGRNNSPTHPDSHPRVDYRALLLVLSPRQRTSEVRVRHYSSLSFLSFRELKKFISVRIVAAFEHLYDSGSVRQISLGFNCVKKRLNKIESFASNR